MKWNKFKLSFLIFLIFFFSYPTVINLNNNINLLADNVVENSENFSEKLKTSIWDWIMTEVVSTESINVSENPTIAVDGSGNVHIAWDEYTDYDSSGQDYDIFYKRWNATMKTWTTTEVVSTESTTNSEHPTIAVDGSGNVHIAWDDSTDYDSSGPDLDIFYKCWNATTEAWTTTEVVSTESIGSSTDPTIAVDGFGNIHIAWSDSTDYDSSGSDPDIFYKCWNATTAAWTTTEVVSKSCNGDSLYPTIAVDASGNVFTAWDDSTDSDLEGDCDIFCSFRNAITGIWTTLNTVSAGTTDDSWYPTIAVDVSGNVHIAWQDFSDYIYADYTGADSDIFYKCVYPIESATQEISNEITSDSWRPTLAVDDSGNLHIAWWELNNISYKCRNATTAAWTTTEVVSTESPASSTDPTIAVDGSGNVHIAWSDATDYDSSGPDIDIFYKKLISSPLNPSIVINNGDETTGSRFVTLMLSADGAEEMCFRNGTTGAWTSWETYSTTKQLYLEGSVNNMLYSIYVKFRNVIGETAPVSDSIKYLIIGGDGGGSKGGGGENKGTSGIPGYPVELLIISLLAGTGVIIILYKSKRKKLEK